MARYVKKIVQLESTVKNGQVLEFQNGEMVQLQGGKLMRLQTKMWQGCR